MVKYVLFICRATFKTPPVLAYFKTLSTCRFISMSQDFGLFGLFLLKFDFNIKFLLSLN